MPGFETAWTPGVPITSHTALAPLLATLGFGKGEAACYAKIVDKFQLRNIKTVGDLDSTLLPEVVGMLRTCGLSKHPITFIRAIESAANIKLRQSHAPTGEGVRAQRGGGMMGRCYKTEPSAGFIPRKFKLDARVFAGLPERDMAKHLDSAEEARLADSIWIFVNAHPEETIGPYLHDGMAKVMGQQCEQRVPPAKPIANREHGRSWAKIIALRFQNARQGVQYKRLKFSSAHAHVFDEKIRGALNFVDPDDEELEDNWANDLLEAFLAAYVHGTAQVAPLPPNPNSSPCLA
jgi:hypothetical protein